MLIIFIFLNKKVRKMKTIWHFHIKRRNMQKMQKLFRNSFFQIYKKDNIWRKRFIFIFEYECQNIKKLLDIIHYFDGICQNIAKLSSFLHFSIKSEIYGKFFILSIKSQNTGKMIIFIFLNKKNVKKLENVAHFAFPYKKRKYA